MKRLLAGALALGLSLSTAAASISALQGATWLDQGQEPQGGSNVQLGSEWFSRYAVPTLNEAMLGQFRNAPGDGLPLYAVGDSVRVSYLGTGAARNSNLFLAAAGQAFDAAAFWTPIYASGGSNQLARYNPVSAANQLFETRSACTYQQAKAGDSCRASQIGMTREIGGLLAGDALVFGLQALPLVFDGINIPHTHYFFSGPNANNADALGWADAQFHAKVVELGQDTLLVGFEDQWLGRGSISDRDYNDMIFLFQGVRTHNSVPEPGLLGLLGSAFVAVALVRRRGRARA